ncbi:hypothetical protein B0H63DRAFT_527606 [Podospora didyma]|uniref:Uncharacterized protein n=1 Tax=Podospora didyma TaxID=330526 RepID=A0AAE0N4E7_9PEZI|nr:hypothetical protein B0H63DRAFT_527606 [Podospora didyma]
MSTPDLLMLDDVSVDVDFQSLVEICSPLWDGRIDPRALRPKIPPIFAADSCARSFVQATALILYNQETDPHERAIEMAANDPNALVYSCCSHCEHCKANTLAGIAPPEPSVVQLDPLVMPEDSSILDFSNPLVPTVIEKLLLYDYGVRGTWDRIVEGSWKNPFYSDWGESMPVSFWMSLEMLSRYLVQFIKHVKRGGDLFPGVEHWKFLCAKRRAAKNGISLDPTTDVQGSSPSGTKSGMEKRLSVSEVTNKEENWGVVVVPRMKQVGEEKIAKLD